MPQADNLLVLGSFGANRAMESEIRRLLPRAVPGFRVSDPRRLDEQTLAFPFHPEAAWALLRYLRSAQRILWEVYETGPEAVRLEPLYESLRGLVAGDTRAIWPSHARISVYTKETQDFPASPMQLRGTVKNALIDGARERGITLELDPDQPDVTIAVRGTPPRIAIDLGGGALGARGWRVDHGEAPLAESLAAQLLLLARYDPRTELLLDPMAGSGTIPIEASFIARGAARDRRLVKPPLPVFEGLPESTPDLFPIVPQPIVGLEVSAADVRAAEQNRARAEVTDVQIVAGDYLSLDRAGLAALVAEQFPLRPELPERGLIIANPPYGERIGRGQDLPAVYRSLRDLLERLGTGWRAAFIVANPEFEPAFGLQPILRKPVSNGGLRAYFLVYALDGARPWQRPPEPRRPRR